MTTVGDIRNPAVVLPASPVARRLATPSWRDGRLLVGVLLLLVSIVVGARVLGSGNSMTPVVTAAHDLSAGHVLVAADLTSTSVRLGAGASGSYFPSGAASGLLGRALTRPVGQGELLPSGAIASGTAAGTEEVSIEVADGRHPALHAGDHVDVYATEETKNAGADVCTTLLIGQALEVVDDVTSTTGASSTGVVLRVPPTLAPTIVHAGESAAVDLVRDPVGAAGVGVAGAGGTGAAGGADPAGAVPSQAPVQALGSIPSGACATGK